MTQALHYARDLSQLQRLRRVGDPINVATRLVQHAKPGEVLLEEGVYQAAAPAIRLDS